MSYLADLSEHWMHVADYVDRILKGAVPGDLPVMIPTKFKLVLNLKTARGAWTHIAAVDPGARRRSH